MEGHFGMEKTVSILHKHFCWPKLWQDVNKYIRSCTACAIAKPTIKKQGLYTPLSTLERPWECILMDYMSGLPSTNHDNDYVCGGFLVCEDGHYHILQEEHHNRR
jgi:hypothetical protein